MTTAFVLSGGGNRGPLQVGALAALLERGIVPDMMVGTSAGSLNSGFMAAKGPELATIPLLMDAWRSATGEVVYPGNVFTIAGRLIDGQDGLFPTEGMRQADQRPPAAGRHHLRTTQDPLLPDRSGSARQAALSVR